MERKKLDHRAILRSLNTSFTDKEEKENSGKLLYEENGKNIYWIIDLLILFIFLAIGRYLYLNNIEIKVYWWYFVILLIIGIIYSIKIRNDINYSKYEIKIYENYVIAKGVQAIFNNNEIIVDRHKVLNGEGGRSTIQGYLICQGSFGRKDVIIIFAEKYVDKSPNKIIIEKLNTGKIINALEQIRIKNI
ncbi:hypothetical protein KQI69_00555 [Eubacterium sp. MSJ-13]|uniref:hypothetical protein n=1 Tax=Eubacterium sp. MSJ-13 TaxID=2841513 RepID=UPI001C114C5C|nr:hypothetical protein [Eubacterium sp. MSJ-13]MBU5477691.1 hypothetical protein [Eubacterium sp. MSJ-13]